MVSENFKTLKELYIRVLPALKSKVKELKTKNIFYITEEDIWQFLKTRKWHTKSDLTLYDIVNDILFLEETELINYINKLPKIEKINESIEEKRKEEDTIL